MLKRTVLVGFLILTSFAWAAQSKDEVHDRLDSATKVLREIMNAPDKGIPEEVLDGAKCVAVVPHMIKGGLVFGAQHGRGIATCRLSKGRWSAPAFFALTGGSWGAQIGAEGVDLVMLVMNEKGMNQLLSSKFQIGADASAAAGPVGRHASAGTDWKLDTEILTYSRAKGAFAGITLNGSKIDQDRDSTVAFYGKALPLRATLTGKVRTPASARPFIAAVSRAKVMGKT
jgi:SH3 domain-containing YSC84-like protein 1